MTPVIATQTNHRKKAKENNPFTVPGWRSCRSCPCQSSGAEGLEYVSVCGVTGIRIQRLTLVDVGQNTTLCNSDVSQKLVQLLIVADGELEMTGNDTGLLVVTGSVASKFQDFGGEILENGSEVDGSTSTDALGIVALAEKTVDTTNGESQTSLGGTAKTTS